MRLVFWSVRLARQPADALSGCREDYTTSAVSDGGGTSHGSRIGPGTAANRRRDFAESAAHENLPQRLAIDVLLVVAGQNKVTHSAAIIAQRHLLAICDDALVLHQSHAITPTESKFSSYSLWHNDYRLSLRRGGMANFTFACGLFGFVFVVPVT
jgi:hypothetical protein